MVSRVRHMFLECPVHNEQRFATLPPEAWEILPGCLRLHGILPLKVPALPEGYPPTPDDMAELTASVQYALLDILQQRDAFCSWQPPQPRWAAARGAST